LKRLALNANLGLSRKAMEQHGILQYYCRFVPIYDFARTTEALRRVADGFWHPLDLRMLRALSRVTGRPIEAMRAAAYHKAGYAPRPVAYSLDHRIEQAPNPDSRVTLTNQRDALGMPKAKLHWTLNDIDYRTFERGQHIVTTELARAGMGVFKAEPLTRELVDAGVEGHYHHIGTTRMGWSEKDSVVDKNCQIHGVSNLFIAGSSVFPSAGYSGPTMMLIAFAIRLAEHIVAKGSTVD
jgi:choline dehydrogenase-like flavoprotein